MSALLIRKIFIIAGSLTILLVAGLSLFGLWVLEKGRKDLNRKKTEKARQTKLDNLDDKLDDKPDDYENPNSPYFPKIKVTEEEENGKTESK